jgi:hypothetical protein
MANTDTPFGLKPLRHKSGAPYNGACNPYYVPATYATALFIGDAVIKTGTSNTTVVEGYPIGSLPEINAATVGDGNRITGVIVGFGPSRTNLSLQYKPASTERVVWVCDDPDVVFLIQSDSAAALAATTVGLNAVLIATHAGNTVTGLSGLELDAGGDVPAADASNQLVILRLHPSDDNEMLVHAKWEVMINQHTESAGTVGSLGI